MILGMSTTFFQDICSEVVFVTASGSVAVQPIIAILFGYLFSGHLVGRGKLILSVKVLNLVKYSDFMRSEID